MPSASAGTKSTATPSNQDEQEPGGIPVEELEAKMLSVKKALERFDSVKVRSLDLFRQPWREFHLPYASWMPDARGRG